MRRKKKVYYSTPTPEDRERLIKKQEAEVQNLVKDLLDKERAINQEKQSIDVDRGILNETIHEIRNINKEIKSITSNLVDSLSKKVDEKDEEDRLIVNTLKTLEANTSLLSIRMDAYDYSFNPALVNREELVVNVGIYSKIEKVYKCLYSRRTEKGININLNGKTELKFRLRNSIELAFFIIIENALKYSPQGEDININFKETPASLIVVFENWGICPLDDEIEFLTERGYRSRLIRDNRAYKGNGLGLYLLKQICGTNNVQFKIKVGNEPKFIKGVEYRKFIVVLVFTR